MVMPQLSQNLVISIFKIVIKTIGNNTMIHIGQGAPSTIINDQKIQPPQSLARDGFPFFQLNITVKIMKQE